jgi:homoserine kinase
MNQWIKIKSPATVANMVCGFDILGFAVERPFDEMEMRLVPRAVGQSIVDAIKIINLDEYNLPTEPEKNVAGAALIALIEEYEEKQLGATPLAFEVKINKLIKPGSGVGSSAASSAPCIFGGVTLVRSIFPLEIITLPSPSLHVTIVHPQIEIRTADARSILKQQVQLKDAIKQWGHIAGLVAGLMKGDYDLIGRSLEDVIIEPVRSILIPGFDELKKACIAAGALGGGISGSGPSIFFLSMEKVTAIKVEDAMKALYTRMGLAHHTYVTSINQSGVQII